MPILLLWFLPSCRCESRSKLVLFTDEVIFSLATELVTELGNLYIENQCSFYQSSLTNQSLEECRLYPSDGSISRMERYCQWHMSESELHIFILNIFMSVTMTTYADFCGI